MKKKYLIVIFLIVASFIAYSQILGNGFINFDDPPYITENNHIKSGINPESIKWAFSAVEFYYWQPLTWLSHMLDWSLFKEHAGGHHFISLLLHIGSVLFLFFFLNKMTKNLWPSVFVAALFALHPLRVESVAWAAERKDVLSMFFGMASIYAYACYAESSRQSRYYLCLILFSLSLMAKPMMVTLPFVLLLLDYWPLGRWQKVLLPADTITEKKISEPLMSRFQISLSLLGEKVPFIFLTVLSSIMTFWGQYKFGVVISMEKLPLSMRVQNAVISYVSYLEKTFWPINLAAFYPYQYSFPLWQVLLSCFILIIITVIVIYTFRKFPFLFVGWFWYLGTLIPVIGLVQVTYQAMADRFTYLPSIGIAIMLAWGIPLLCRREETCKKILFPSGIAILAILAVLTWQQCGYWKNSVTVFSRALQVTKDNFIAHNCLALALFEEGKTGEAIDQYNKVIRLKPNNALPYSNRGNAYAKLGQYQQAVEDFNKAIRLKPDYADFYYKRGNAHVKLEQYPQATEDFNLAIRLKPNYADAYNSRGFTYLLQGDKKLGCPDAQKACELGNCKAWEWAQSKGDCG